MASADMNIDWHTNANHLLLNPRLSEPESARLRRLAAAGSELRGHVFIATSGSTAAGIEHIKLVAISKTALLISAAAVNWHLQSSASDIWLHALPDFHVGGIGIWARSHLNGARVVKPFAENSRWDPAAFCDQARTVDATLSALVPAQLHDIVKQGLRAPASLRAIIIGGDRLGTELYVQARELGWNVLPSYGMSEAGSQVATAPLDSLSQTHLPRLQLLDTFAADVDAAIGCLKLKSPSLFSGYCVPAPMNPAQGSFVDPKIDGWFVTSDCGQVDAGRLTIEGRRQDIVKIGGENVSLPRLDRILDEIKLEHRCELDLAIAAVSDDRLSNIIELACAAPVTAAVEKIVASFNSRILPYERIRNVHYGIPIPRTALGKLNRAGLAKLLQSATRIVDNERSDRPEE